MRKLLLTIATDEIREIASPFLVNQAAYAKRNNYEYEAFRKRFPLEFFESNHPSFSKVPHALDALNEGYDVVLYADCDIAFMDQGVDLVNLLTGDFWMAAYCQNNWDQFKYLCAGLWIVKNTPTCRAFFEEWKDRCIRGCPAWKPGERTPVVDHPWEQWFYSSLIQECNYEGIRCCTAQEIGSFAPEIWDDGIKFKRGFPTVHFAGQGKTMEEKAKIFMANYAPLVC